MATTFEPQGRVVAGWTIEFSRRRRVALSQVNARQKLRRLIRMAFAATSTRNWLASALLLGVSTNALYAQAPTTLPSGAQQSISDRGAVNAPAAAPQGATSATAAPGAAGPDVVMRWLNTTADAAAKGDIKTACDAFARALVNNNSLQVKDDRVTARMGEVQKMLIEKKVTKQQIQEAIYALGPKQEAAPASKVAMVPPPPLTGVQPASGNQPVMPAAGPMQGGVQPGVFNPQQDSSRIQAAGNLAMQAGGVPSGASGEELYRLGMEALQAGNRERALELFRRAWSFQGELDPALKTALKDKLSALQASELKIGGEDVPAVDAATQETQLLRSRLISEITSEIANAEAQRAEEPHVVADRLSALRSRVSQADLDGATRKQMLSIVDRAITTHQSFMEQNRAAIDQNMKNRSIQEQVSLEQEQTYKVDQKIAGLTEQFNQLMDEGRYSEAEVIAKQVEQLRPGSQIAQLLYQNARMAKRNAEYVATKNLKEDNFIDLMNAVDAAVVVPTENMPLQFGDAKSWASLTERRNTLNRADQQGMTPAEAAIYDRLKQQVQVDFKNRPLSEVVKLLGDMTGILMHIDAAGLASEGLQPDVPVNLSLGPTQTISLRSALNLLLNPHNLSYRVQDEVLLITSARSTGEANIRKTYSVKDLVIPIPNFVSDYNSGMGGALRAAYESIGAGLAAKTLVNPNSPAASLMAGNIDNNPAVLGQVVPGMPGGIGGVGGGMGGIGGLMPWNNNGPVSGSNPGFMQAGAVPVQSVPLLPSTMN